MLIRLMKLMDKITLEVRIAVAYQYMDKITFESCLVSSFKECLQGSFQGSIAKQPSDTL